jgi:hypothetical protein
MSVIIPHIIQHCTTALDNMVLYVLDHQTFNSKLPDILSFSTSVSNKLAENKTELTTDIIFHHGVGTESVTQP